VQWAGRLRAIRSSIDKESKSVKAKVEAKVGAVESKVGAVETKIETEVADIKAKVGAVEEKLDAIMELLLRDVSAVPAPPPASSSSALQAAEPTVAGASEAPDEAPRNTKKSVMRKMSSKFS
jgi:ribosomal protein L12E/L44/L45/RPP1/RPP2